MYKFNEESLRKGIQFGLGSQGIWTPELEDIMFNEITNEALRIHDVSGSVCPCNELPDGEIAVSSKALQKPYGDLGQTDC